MVDRIISTFGTYDFLGKTLPGMTLVIGVAVVIPTGIIVPQNQVNVGFLFVLSILLIVGLIGTLIGEFVHGIANIFEKLVGWILPRGWAVYLFLNRLLSVQPYEEPEPAYLVIELEDDEQGSENIGVKEPGSSSNGKDGLKHDIRQWWRRRRANFSKWRRNQIRKFMYIITPHREIFFRRFNVILADDFRLDKDIQNATFAEEYFMKEIASKKFGVSDASDINQAYSVVVSMLADSDYDRAFRFQARYSFCRSMWVVTFILAFVYTIILFAKIGYLSLIPPLQSLSIICYFSGSIATRLESLTLFMVVIFLTITGLVFAFASGSYKENYINYLVAGIYSYEIEHG